MTDVLMHGALSAPTEKTTLKAWVKDFVSMTLMIRQGHTATELNRFMNGVAEFFSTLERNARKAGFSDEQVKDVQYALCAFLDETVLNGENSVIKRQLVQISLQQRYFGAHLAGEGFFDKIEVLRSDVKRNLDVLEVYHLCLALGFEGKYGHEHKDQLRYIASTLGQDIARYRKAPKSLSSGWELPELAVQRRRHQIPVWLYLTLIAAISGGLYLTLNWLLNKQVSALSAQVSRLFGI